MRSASSSACLHRLLILAFLLLPAAAFDNDFSLYPEGARSCLDTSARDSACEGDNASVMNSCLCSNGGSFVESSAVCIGKQSPADLGAVWDKMSVNCDGTSTPLSISRNSFIDIGEENDSTTSSTPSSTATTSASVSSVTSIPTTSNEPTSTASGSPDRSDDEVDAPATKGMSTAEIIGVSVVSVVAAGCLAAGAFVFFRRRRGRPSSSNRGEYHPMTIQSPSAPPSGGAAAVGYPGPTDSSPKPVWSVGSTKTPEWTPSPASMNSGWTRPEGTGYQAPTPSGPPGQHPAYGQQPGYYMPGAQQETIHELPLSPPRQMHVGAAEMPGSFPEPAEQQSTAYRGAGDLSR